MKEFLSDNNSDVIQKSTAVEIELLNEI